MKYLTSIQSVLFFLLFVSLPFSSVKVFFASLPVYLPEVVVLLLTAVFFLRLPSEIVFPKKLFLSGIALFVGGALLSFVTNPYSLTGIGMLKSWFFFPLLAAVFLYLFVQEEREEAILWMWFLVSGGVLCAALLFFFQGEVTYDGRLQAFYTSPNFLAVVLAPSVLIGIYFFLQEKVSRGIKISISGMLLLLLWVLFLTHSYGVWVALFLSTLFFFVSFSWKDIQKHVVLLGGILLIVGTFLALEYDSAKWQALVSFEERSSLSSRFMIWRASMAILQDHFLLGIGVGRFQEMYLAYQTFFSPYLEWAVPQPHNLYLALLLQTGLLGFVGFLSILVSYVLSLREAWFQGSVPRNFLLLCFSLIFFYLSYGIFDTPYFKTDLAYSFWIVIALGMGVALRKKKAS